MNATVLFTNDDREYEICNYGEDNLALVADGRSVIPLHGWQLAPGLPPHVHCSGAVEWG